MCRAIIGVRGIGGAPDEADHHAARSSPRAPNMTRIALAVALLAVSALAASAQAGERSAERLHSSPGIFLLVAILSLCICPTKTFAGPITVEPDRLYAKVHNWRISTARFGVGCIAIFPYGPWNEISIGGEKWDELALIVTLERQKFSGNLDDESDVNSIELVLDDKRWGGLDPYGYRGTAGVVLSANKQIVAKLATAPTLKLTERGSLKLKVPLRNTGESLKKLAECFKRTR
jgi:hypothetical protein